MPKTLVNQMRQSFGLHFIKSTLPLFLSLSLYIYVYVTHVHGEESGEGEGETERESFPAGGCGASAGFDDAEATGNRLSSLTLDRYRGWMVTQCLAHSLDLMRRSSLSHGD